MLEFSYVLCFLLGILGTCYADSQPDRTAVYGYSAVLSFKGTGANISLAFSKQSAPILTGQLHVSTLWTNPKNQNDFLLYIQPVSLASAAADLTDLPFLLHFRPSSQAKFYHKTDSQTSRKLKSALVNCFSAAIGDTEQKASTLPVKDQTDGPWDVAHVGFPNAGAPHRIRQDENPIQKRKRLAESIRFLTGEDKEWKRFELAESTSMTAPWTDLPAYHIDALTTLSWSEWIQTPEQVAALRSNSFQDTLAKNKDFEEGKQIDEASTLDVEEDLSQVSKVTLMTKLNRLRKYTLKSQAATVNASRAFLALHSTLRYSEKADIVAALRETMKLKKKQKSSIFFLLDAIAAHQSTAGLAAVTEVLEYGKKADQLELFKRYIMASSFATDADEIVIVQLLEVMKAQKPDSNLEETLALSIGALTYTHICKSASSSDGKLYEMVAGKFVDSLRVCAGPDMATCQIKWLRALGNAADPKTLPVLLEYVHLGGRAGPAAIRALRRHNLTALPSKLQRQVKEAVWNAYENSSTIYDSSCKIAAVEWLIKANAKDAKKLARIIEQVPRLRGEELRTYVVAALTNTIKDTALLRQSFSLAAAHNRRVTYAELGAIGQSISYEGLLSEKRLLNATYSLGMEFSGGTMKTSAVGVSLNDEDTTLPIVSFGLFARGLGAFMGATDEADAAESATAGLSLELLDVSLPSVVFFNGLSELMSLALSAGGSDPVAEMQFNLLVQNSRETDTLHNGIPVRTSARTALSADLAGFVEVSLWGRTFKSLVRNRAALTTEMVTETGFRSNRLKRSVTELVQGKMDFVTNVDFSSFPVKLCMQMSNSPVSYRRHEMTVPAAGGATDRSNRWSVTPAKSFYFGVKNTKYCNDMS